MSRTVLPFSLSSATPYFQKLRHLEATQKELEIAVEALRESLAALEEFESAVRVRLASFRVDANEACVTLLDKLSLLVPAATNLEWAVVVGASREREAVAARSLVYLFLARAGLSTTRTGQLLGRHHATVLHSLNTARYLLETEDPGFMRPYRQIKEALDR